MVFIVTSDLNVFLFIRVKFFFPSELLIVVCFCHYYVRLIIKNIYLVNNRSRQMILKAAKL